MLFVKEAAWIVAPIHWDARPLNADISVSHVSCGSQATSTMMPGLSWDRRRTLQMQIVRFAFATAPSDLTSQRLASRSVGCRDQGLLTWSYITAEPYMKAAALYVHWRREIVPQFSVVVAPSKTLKLSSMSPTLAVQSYTLFAQTTYVPLFVCFASRAASKKKVACDMAFL